MAGEMSRQLVRYCRYPAPLDLLLVAVWGKKRRERRGRRERRERRERRGRRERNN